MLIEDCLSALFANNDIGEQLEVIVVDNNSDDYEQTQKRIVNYGQRVKLIRNDSNGGYGQGNNIGINNSSAPYIMIMNPDVRLNNISLQQVYETFDNNNHVAIYGIKQLDENHRPSVSFSLLNSYNGSVRYFGNILCNKLNIYSHKHMYFSGALFFIRKSSFLQCGCFDENMFLYGEENDIHHRLLRSYPNSKSVYNAQFTYVHAIGKRSFSEQTLRRRVQSNIYVFEKQGKRGEQYINSEIIRLRCSCFVGLLRHIDTSYDKQALQVLNDIKQKYVVKN